MLRSNIRLFEMNAKIRERRTAHELGSLTVRRKRPCIHMGIMYDRADGWKPSIFLYGDTSKIDCDVLMQSRP